MADAVPQTLGVVMDPIAEIHPEKDTTLGLLEAAQRKGWRLTYFEQDDLYLRDGEARGRGRELSVSLDTRSWFRLEDARDTALAELDVILMRKDPPLDLEFLYTCCLLEHATRDGTLVVNNPQAIRLANEKMFAQRFADLAPATLVTRDRRRIARFVEEHGDAVVKPLDDMGGAAVFRLRGDDQNIEVIVEEMTRGGRRSVMTQALIKGYEKGDKRILLIDGQPVPFALTRVPPPGRLRANLAAGGRGVVSELDDRDREICARVAPVLSDLGLLFVGLDVIGGFLTEINVSSPTCLREISAERNVDVAMQVMDAITERFAALRS